MSLSQFGGTAEHTGRAMVLADGLLDGPESQKKLSRPFGVDFGICGVGLFGESRSNLKSAIFIDQPPKETKLQAFGLTDFPKIRDALGLAFGGDRVWLERDVLVVPVPQTGAQAAPGDYVKAGAPGQLGCPVKWGSGPSNGILTAGHVALSVGTIAYDAASKQIGTVKFVLNPSPGSGAIAGIDVAVIEFATGVVAATTPKIVSAAIPPPGAAVEVHVQRSHAATIQPTKIYGSAGWWYAVLSNVTYSDVYISGGVTQAGDSGGPAFLQGVVGRVIGHVVCGAPTVSCIQDIQQQLKAISNDPVFASISL
jgi:hypothetical protein